MKDGGLILPVPATRRRERHRRKASTLIQNLEHEFGVDSRHRMNEHASAVDPRTEHVRPGGLGPAGVRHVPVDVRLAQVQPVAGGQRVTEAVAGARQLCHLGVSGRPTGEEHLHDVRTQRANCLYTHSKTSSGD